ncbi:serine-threonine protein kinase, plant-type, putative [Ricinus communis]|uniref:Serine-threonine protein kinase, plant-type, putative n=1 Tax=Ricinus communis TaxID=3988 RepID=B9SB44_RICCO|nr:serine-threonine protein kinase, plant-type, putative [Ricinus communis]
MESQRVVVIQDASREVCSSALRWAFQGLSLKPGDMLTFLAVLHQVDNPCKSPYAGSRKLLGYKSKVDSNSMFGTNEKIVNREAARKKEEYGKNAELVQVSKLYEMQKVVFKIEVATGPSPKVVALKAAENLKATWVILDRQMKRDRKYFLAKLSCGISRMKRNNMIKQLRGPKPMPKYTPLKKENLSSLITYDDMVPGTPDDLFSIEIRPSVAEADQERQVQEITHGSEKAREEWQAEEVLQNSMCALCKNRRPSNGCQMDFTYAELHAATDGFSPKNYLYEGGFGSAFRGHLKSRNLKIVVKQQKTATPQKEMNFSSEINLLRHKNVLMLLGSYATGSLKLLVYEYACNGSLKQYLSKHCPLPLTWAERMKVALGAARGLDYLHKNNIVHKNVTASSIVLTHEFEPLVMTWQLIFVYIVKFVLHIRGKILETLDYLAPEYAGNWQLLTASDVYAFGVVLLELISGQMVTDKMPEGKSLVGWARPLLKERRLLEIIDPRIANSHDGEQIYWMGRLIQNCLHKIPDKRLTMDKVTIICFHSAPTTNS